MSFTSDLLFLPKEMKKIYDTLKKSDKPNKVRYIEIESNYGHDAFLVEYDKFSHYIKEEL
jgi:homoserine O-acetyltransferase